MSSREKEVGAAACYPTDPLSSLELHNLSHDVPELHKIHQSTDFEALELCIGRSGNFCAHECDSNLNRCEVEVPYLFREMRYCEEKLVFFSSSQACGSLITAYKVSRWTAVATAATV